MFIKQFKGALLYNLWCIVRCAIFVPHQSLNLHKEKLPSVREVARRSRDGGIAMQYKHNKQLVSLAKQLQADHRIGWFTAL